MPAQYDVLMIASRWLHFASFIAAVGGTIFLRFLLHPAMAATALPEQVAAAFRNNLLRRWARALHVCIALLILTGLYNAFVQFPRHPAIPGGMPVYHVVFGIKMILVLALFFIAIAISGHSQAFEPMRRRRPMWMLVNLALAAAIVLLSNILKFTPTTLP